MPKNIIVFSDGTGNKPFEDHDTNVRKPYDAVKKIRTDQVAFYDGGVGTDFWRIMGLAFVKGLAKNIRECYEFIVYHYQPGDSIFLFGFSRGAFTARGLGGAYWPVWNPEKEICRKSG